MEVLWNNW